jgi:3-methyladenine DNA glycosylase AlkC
MNMDVLFARAFPALAARAPRLRDLGLVMRLRTGGAFLWEELGLDSISEGTRWPSDTARGWAAMAVGAAPEMPLSTRLELIQPYADDPHFAVREWAWLSLRPHVAVNLDSAIQLLIPWTSAYSSRLRRFASEVTRPRGVWSRHIPSLKADPSPARCLLDPLRHDPVRYVQDSVGNWLNDASKTSPRWVIETCARWLGDGPSEATRRICRRATRTVGLYPSLVSGRRMCSRSS